MAELRDGDRLLGDLLFQVRDTGIGTSAEQSANLFQRFSQADASIARQYGAQDSVSQSAANWLS